MIHGTQVSLPAAVCGGGAKTRSRQESRSKVWQERVKAPKVKKFLQLANFFKSAQGDSGQLKSQQTGPFFGQVKKTPAVASHGHPAVRGRIYFSFGRKSQTIDCKDAAVIYQVKM